MHRLAALLAIALLAGCQTRQANPVEMSQPGDAALECAQIAEMRRENRLLAARLAKLDENIALGNAIAVTISQVWFWGGVFGVDLSDSEEIQTRALLDRNRRLAEIAEARGCAASTAASEPVALVKNS